MFYVVDKHLENIKNILDNDMDIKKMLDLKKEIMLDDQLKTLLKENKSDNNYELIELRKKVFNEPRVKEYKALENRLIYIILEINQKLDTLVR